MRRSLRNGCLSYVQLTLNNNNIGELGALQLANSLAINDTLFMVWKAHVVRGGAGD